MYECRATYSEKGIMHILKSLLKVFGVKDVQRNYKRCYIENKHLVYVNHRKKLLIVKCIKMLFVYHYCLSDESACRYFLSQIYSDGRSLPECFKLFDLYHILTTDHETVARITKEVCSVLPPCCEISVVCLMWS